MTKFGTAHVGRGVFLGVSHFPSQGGETPMSSICFAGLVKSIFFLQKIGFKFFLGFSFLGIFKVFFDFNLQKPDTKSRPTSKDL